MTGLGPPHAPYLPDRIRTRLEVVESSPGVFCWVWQGYVTDNGYGRVSVPNGRRHYEYVHRYVFAAHGRPLIPGLVLDHLCRVRACANPAHLEQVSQQLNSRRGLMADHHTRGTCRAGAHDVTGPDALYRPPGGGRAECAECRRARGRRKGAA